MVSGPPDDPSARRRGAVPPPPSLGPDEPPAPVVPRMEPPPASLEAMVHSGRAGDEASVPAWLWIVLLVVAAAVTAYVMR